MKINPLQSSPSLHLGFNLRSRRRFLGMSAGLALGLLASCSASNSSEVAGSSFELQLANHLTESGAKMYGAFWCPHCQTQKAQFGSAVDAIPYVECDPEGENAQPDVCQAKNIQGYPTWEINGELSPGVKSLGELAELSGFSGEIPEMAYEIQRN